MESRSLLRCLSCLPIAFLLLSCQGDDDGSNGDNEGSSSINLAFIPKTGNNIVFDMGNDGAQFTARYLTAKEGVEVNVEYMAPAELYATAEQQMVRDAIAAKKDGIVVSCIDDSITEPIDEAVAAGIPVITYDSDCPDSKRLGFYSMQSEATGAKSADLLVSAMGEGKKTIAILTGRKGADNLERRIVGFTDRLTAKYPDITVETTVNCMETAESCGAAVEDDIIDQYPELDGLFVVGLWGLLDACTCGDDGMTCSCDDSQMPKWKKAAKGKLKTVAYDSLPVELALMEQGYVSALIGQSYFGWGYDTVTLMFEHLTHGSKIDKFIDSGFDVVCQNNASDMLSKWKASDFSTPLKPACDL
jgi:ribose transport system substrate-binding protein